MLRYVFSTTLLSIFLLCGCSIHNSIAQDYNIPKFNSIVPPSPNASSLGIYGDIPVSEYTGTTNINIPLYSIKSRNLTLPISLNYHSSGIKVEQEASWVGLGWALKCGGVVTRSVRGVDDLKRGSGYPYIDIQLNIDSNGRYNPNIPNMVNEYSYFYRLNYEKDGEPDVFYFDFNGYSGKFFFKKKRNINDRHEFYIESQQKISIELHEIDDDKFEWIFTAPDGTKYFFGTQERTKTFDRVEGAILEPIPTLDYLPGSTTFDNELTTSWYLDKIVSQEGDRIEFVYTPPTEGIRSKVRYNEMRYRILRREFHLDNTYELPFEYTPSQHFYPAVDYVYEVYLKEILFNNGKIEFFTSDRHDIQPIDPDHKPKRLDSLVVYSKALVGDSYEYLKQINLTYSYFNSTENTFYKIQNYSYEYETTYSSKRLKLLSVYEKSGHVLNAPYIFDYFVPEGSSVGDIPDKYSKSKDRWGYFNGKDNRLVPDSTSHMDTVSTLIPSFFDHINNKYYPGANRDPDNNLMKIGMLDRITYPLDGETQFEFEANDFIENGVLQSGGGIRIAKITHTDGEDPGRKMVKRYSYKTMTNEGEKSTGLSMSPFRYYYFFDIQRTRVCGHSCLVSHTTYYLSSSSESNILLGTSASGSSVGYSKVTVYEGENGEGGKTEYVYRNTPDSLPAYFFPFLPNTVHLDNGLLTSETAYRKGGGGYKKVKEKTMTYKNVSPMNEKIMGVKCLGCDRLEGPTNPLTLEDLKVQAYYMKSEWWHPETETVTVYDDTLSTSIMTRYFYENSNHYQLTKTVVSGSREEDIITEYSYPLDYTHVSNGIISLMKQPDRHMHNTVIEKVVKQKKGEDEKVVHGEFVSHAELVGPVDHGYASVILPLNIHRLQMKEPKSTFIDSKLTGQATDPDYIKTTTIDYSGNKISNIQVYDKNPTFYIWGYRDEYPIAEIQNTHSDYVFYTSFEDILGNSDDFDSRTGKKSRTGGFTRQLLGRKNGVYQLSYWQKVDGEWQHIVVNDIVVSNSKYTIELTGQVDEVRFHPVEASITTYTYEPLVGMTSMTDNNGYTTFYEYDNFQRLSYVRDHEKNVLQKIVYNSKGRVEGYEDGIMYDTRADWKKTGVCRCATYNGLNTGEEDEQHIDINYYSPTYRQMVWKNAGVTGNCPLPVIYAKLTYGSPRNVGNRTETSVYVSFYENENATQPFYINRPIDLYYIVSTYENYPPYNISDEFDMVTIPKDTQQYYLGEEIVEDDYSTYVIIDLDIGEYRIIFL